MAWIYRYADRHRCQLPKIDESATQGDVWKCDECGTMYTVHHDQRDGSYMRKSTPNEVQWVAARAGTVTP